MVATVATQHGFTGFQPSETDAKMSLCDSGLIAVKESLSSLQFVSALLGFRPTKRRHCYPFSTTRHHFVLLEKTNGSLIDQSSAARVGSQCVLERLQKHLD